MGELKCAVIFGAAPVDLTLQPPVPKADYYICADGGVDLARAMDVKPDLILGDFDSVRSLMADVFKREFSPEKDDTDMLLAAKEAMARGCRKLTFYGGLGGRLDHTMANIQLLTYLADYGVQGTFLDAHQMMTMQRNEARTYTGEYHYYSLFSLSEQCCGVTLSGMKYLLEHGTLTRHFPLGVSNEIIVSPATVTVEEGDLLVIAADDVESRT